MAGQEDPDEDETENENEANGKDDQEPEDVGHSGSPNGRSRKSREADEQNDEPHEEDDFRTDLLGKAMNLDLAESGFSIFGWVEANYTANPQLGSSGENNLLLPNSQANAFVFQQVYLVIEQPTRYRDRINFGYRVDNLFGVDAQNFHDYGFLNNTFAPNTFQYDPVQFYGDLHLPLSKGIDVRGGRFYALPGYEAATAPGRPLLSTSDMFSFGAHPYTQFGVMITWHLTDQFELYNGVVNGWNRWINENVPWSYAGGFNWSSADDRTNLTVTLNAGFTQFARVFPDASPIPSRPIPGSGFDPFGLRNSETVLFTEVLTHRLTDDLTLVVEADEAVVDQLQPLLSPGPATGHASYYGLAGWLLEQLTEKTTGVARAEVFRDNNGLLTGYSDNFYEVTLGLIHKPVPWFWIRPEIRYDWAQFTRPFLDANPANSFRTNHRLTFGFDVIMIF